MPGHWASHKPFHGVHCHPESGASVAICMGPPGRTTNRTMSMTSSRRARTRPATGTGCGLLSFVTNPLQVICITANLGQYGSPWIQTANIGIHRNPMGRARDSVRISNQGLHALLIPALTAARYVVSTCSMRGSKSCR